MRTAAYCRYSSDQQRETSIRDQLRNIENYCTRMGWPIPSLYQDQAISGSRNDRPGYLSMLAAVEQGIIDVLLVDDLSRLSRDHIESAQVIRRLKFSGVRVVGVSDGTDTARDGYKLETGLRGLMSELYIDDLAKKTHRGLMGQALAGYSAGGLPYGYQSTSDGNGHKRQIIEEEAQWVRYIFERYAQGANSRAIASELNDRSVPSPRGGKWLLSALYPSQKGVGILGNPIYNGKQVWNRTKWVKDPVTGRRLRTMRPRGEWVVTDVPEMKIIDDDLWAKCEALTNRRRSESTVRASIGKGVGRGKSKYLFSGLLRCGVCGGAFVITDTYNYKCSTNKNGGVSACSNALKVRRSTVEYVLLNGVKEAILNEDGYRHFEAECRRIMQEMRPDKEQSRRKLSTAKKEVDNILTAIKAGIFTASTRAELEDAENRIFDAQEELKAIERFSPEQMLPRAREIYRDLVTQLESVQDVDAVREVLRELIGEVKLAPENGMLTAEVQSAGLAGALKMVGVAGEGFEPSTFGL
ncbi:MAG: recombinase family protein [Proteobacteria bacterium]|nr:recombinase family protein [Pseudomonadota bacterium]